MKYIIMCGGKYPMWKNELKHMIPIKGEPLVARTICLLREEGVDDIAISTQDERFKQFGIPLLSHDNPFIAYNESTYWVDAFYPMREPVCYLMGDVVFSKNAIKTIVSDKVESVEFYASAKPFSKDYIKRWEEPFAFKVNDTEHFRRCIELTKQYQDEKRFSRQPIAWELWQLVSGTAINHIVYNYHAINDFTCDIDEYEDVALIEQKMVGYE